MNYFAHALPFLDQPYFMAGTAVPDWLTVVDRQVRVRSKHVERFCDDPDPCVASVAAGILQHLRDDARFHGTRAFVETSLELTVAVRDALDGESGMRPSFLGHLLAELLLDAALIADDPDKVTAYYRALDDVDAERVEAVVNRVAPRTTERLAMFIELYRREKILCNYLEDDRLLFRLNQVMRRVGLACLPEGFRDVFPAASCLVRSRKEMLLAGIPA